MEFLYDLAGGMPVVRDVPVYDAAAMANGELVMLGTTDPDSNADQGVAFITAYTGSNAEAIDALGPICEDFSTAGTIDNTPAEGSLYLKCIINPLQVMRCEYSQGTSDDIAVTTGGSSTTVTTTSLEDDIDAGWLFFQGASGGDAINKLRFITASASGSCTVDSAITTTTNDTYIKILPQNHRATALNAAATMLTSAAAAGSGVALHVVDNEINSDGHSFQLLRKSSHEGLDGLSNTRIFAHLVMLDHVYNNA